MRNDKENLIVNKTFNFALESIDYSEKLRSLHKYEMASQPFKSGTSIGANTWEAHPDSSGAESNADFIHKFNHYPAPETAFSTELNSIIRIIPKIISSSKNKS